MEKKEFEATIGKEFMTRAGDKTIPLKLLSVDPRKKIEGPENAREEPFTLIFAGPEDQHLPDNAYEMSVEGHEGKTIFISAHKKDAGHIFYDAVFN